MTVAQNNIQEHARSAVQRSTAIAQAGKHNSTLAVVKSFIEKDDVKKRFQDILGKKAGQFLASITSLVSSSTAFNDVDPNSIMASAIVAATLDLPINQNLGFAYIIPYNGREGKKAQFQMGYKGFIQLCLRSGQFKTINATEVYEGEIVGLNRLTGEISMDEEKRKSQKVIGYASYFRLLNGFEKTLYMSVESLQEHGKKFSKSFSKDTSLWKTDPHSMYMKTVIKLLLSKYGALSVEMQKAIEVDQGVIKDDNTVDYVDAVDEIPAEALQKNDPAAELAEKSKTLRNGYITLIQKAGTEKQLKTLLGNVNESHESGDLSESDYGEVMTELNEKSKALEG